MPRCGMGRLTRRTRSPGLNKQYHRPLDGCSQSLWRHLTDGGWWYQDPDQNGTSSRRCSQPAIRLVGQPEETSSKPQLCLNMATYRVRSWASCVQRAKGILSAPEITDCDGGRPVSPRGAWDDPYHSHLWSFSPRLGATRYHLWHSLELGRLFRA
jgi:hypothetical protein